MISEPKMAYICTFKCLNNIAMQRIKLGKPYDDFIQSQIDAGYFGTATEVIRDSLRDKMAQAEDNRIAHIKALLEEAELSLKVDGPIDYSPDKMKEIFDEAQKAAKSKFKTSGHIRP